MLFRSLRDNGAPIRKGTGISIVRALTEVLPEEDVRTTSITASQEDPPSTSNLSLPIAVSTFGPIYTQTPPQYSASVTSYSQALGAMPPGQINPSEVTTRMMQPFTSPLSPIRSGTVNHNIFQQGPISTRGRDTASIIQSWSRPQVTRPLFTTPPEAINTTTFSNQSRVPPHNPPVIPFQPPQQPRDGSNEIGRASCRERV